MPVSSPRACGLAARYAAPAWVVVVLALALLAARRSREYADPERLWSRLVAAQPDSVRGMCCLATVLGERGDLVRALDVVERAVALWPWHSPAVENLIEFNLRLGPPRGSALVALAYARAGVATRPHNPFDRLRLSRALAAAAERHAESQWFDAAEAEALHCLEIAVPRPLVFRTAASARTRQGNHARAVELLADALARGLVSAELLLDLAQGQRALGRVADADVTLQRALRDFPFDPAVMQHVLTPAGAPR